MFAENIGVNIALIDVVILGKSGTKTRRVKNCARTYDVVFGKSRFFEECVRQNVNGIADNYVNGVRSVFCDFGNNGLCDVNIGLSKFKTGLSGPSCDTRC